MNLGLSQPPFLTYEETLRSEGSRAKRGRERENPDDPV